MKHSGHSSFLSLVLLVMMQFSAWKEALSGQGLRNPRTMACLPSGTMIAPSSSQLAFSYTPPLVHQQVLPALLPKQAPNPPASSRLPSDH